MRGPPEKRPRRVAADQGCHRNFQLAHPTRLAPARQYSEKDFSPASLCAVIAALRDDGGLPIGLGLLALRASYRPQYGTDLPPDQEREFRHLCARRRQQLHSLARLDRGVR
jgi:hypothetical protein